MSNHSRDLILEKADEYAHSVYKVSKKLPKEELFGLCSQLTRSALSVSLNIVEGYARQSKKSQKQFLVIAFGSLKESQYLLGFGRDEKYFLDHEIKPIYGIGDQVARMLWRKIQTLATNSS